MMGDLRDRLLAARDRWLASPAFQRWVVRFPLTRPIARRRARALFDLCAGFVYSQILLACVQLRLFDRLADGPRTAAQLAEILSLTSQAMERLLRAAASLQLVEPRGGGRYGLGPHGIALRANPGILAMVEHHALLYEDLRDPLALLRGERHGTALGHYWPYAGADGSGGLEGERIAAYTALMSASQPLVVHEVLDGYSFASHRCLLDVGGGDGTFLSAVAERWPHLRLMLFDLPPVAARARARFVAAGLAGRAQAVGGSALTDPLPDGADIISLVRVIHDHDDDAALTLLGAARRALPEDGVLLLAEPMSGTAGAEPVGDAYFGFYLLAMGSGRPRTPQELTRLLNDAGFTRVRPLPTRMPLQTRLLVARP